MRLCRFVTDHIDIDVTGQHREPLGQGHGKPQSPATARGLADDQLRDIAAACIAQQTQGDVLARQGGGFRTQLLGESQGLQNLIASLFWQPLQTRCFDIGGNPVGMQAGRQTRSASDQFLGIRAGTDTDQQALLGLPYTAYRPVVAILAHLRVDSVSGAAQRQLAQCDEITLAEEVLDGVLGLLRKIDLALFQALQQFIGRKIDNCHLVGVIEHLIRYGLRDPHAGDLPDDIVQAFQMLNVDRSVDIDARLQQFLHILPALGVARPGYIGMGEFIDQYHRGLALQRSIQIEFSERLAAVLELFRRENIQPLRAVRRFRRVGGFPPAQQ